MPALDHTAEKISWFEFAPAHLFYAPIALYCGWLGLRYLGLTLLTNANPSLPFSGLVGESKTAVLKEISGPTRSLIAPYQQVLRWSGANGTERTLRDAKAAIAAANLKFPLVAKPDIGMRGAGVQIIKNNTELSSYVETFPLGANLLLQQLINEEGEAGVFYVREPGQDKGRITSLTLKYFPRVTGDGVSTLQELIMHDARASKVAHLYLERHHTRLHHVIPLGESIRLAFAGNHCRGTIFRNGNDQITTAMVDAFDEIAKSMNEFYIGRFDIRFGDFKTLQTGTGFKIIEVNGAGGEQTHIWDSRMTLRRAYRDLMQQFHHLYRIGAINRRRGFSPTSLFQLIKAWRSEKKLTRHYPITH
jgi:hypothetical protein